MEGSGMKALTQYLTDEAKKARREFMQKVIALPFNPKIKAMPCNAGAKHPDIMLGNARLILLRHFNEMVSRLERITDHSRAVLTAAQYGLYDINQLTQ
jgi:putative phosphoheptose isomerase